MKRTSTLLVNVIIAVFAILMGVGIAESAGDFSEVRVRVRVVDRANRPVAGIHVRFTLWLDGVAHGEEKANAIEPVDTRAVSLSMQLEGVTNRDGIATVAATPKGARVPSQWFRGNVRFTAQTVPTHERDAVATGPGSITDSLSVPAVPSPLQSPPSALPTLRIWEAPDTEVDGFPLWLGSDRRADRIIVLVEGFDLYNTYSATDALRLVGSAGDALRRAGVDLLIVNFADSHQSLETLAPTVARAIRAASRVVGGRPVAVAGLSAGGIIARWALVTAEESGSPLPVNTLVFLDTPHRGANLNPALQAMVLSYGKKEDRDALSSDAAHILLTESITDTAHQVRWRRIGPPLAQRQIPVQCMPTHDAHEAFYARLQHLNDRRGYPKQCRLVAVANSSRRTNRPASSLLHLWLPWNSSWTLRTAERDCIAGSLLPRLYVDKFRRNYPLGLAGSYLTTAPTFLPAASALDASPDETPPFDAWYARPEGSTPLAHDDVDPGVAAFVVRELLQSAWK